MGRRQSRQRYNYYHYYYHYDYYYYYCYYYYLVQRGLGDAELAARTSQRALDERPEEGRRCTSALLRRDVRWEVELIYYY